MHSEYMEFIHTHTHTLTRFEVRGQELTLFPRWDSSTALFKKIILAKSSYLLSFYFFRVSKWSRGFKSLETDFGISLENLHE